jgi:hypothetical protein
MAVAGIFREWMRRNNVVTVYQMSIAISDTKANRHFEKRSQKKK